MFSYQQISSNQHSTFHVKQPANISVKPKTISQSSNNHTNKSTQRIPIKLLYQTTSYTKSIHQIRLSEFFLKYFFYNQTTTEQDELKKNTLLLIRRRLNVNNMRLDNKNTIARIYCDFHGGGWELDAKVHRVVAVLTVRIYYDVIIHTQKKHLWRHTHTYKHTHTEEHFHVD